MFDVIIIGTGAMGSSASHYLSDNNLKVLAIDQFTPPHNNGSSHGETRIIRSSYYEHESYVPLIKESFKLWNDLQKKTDLPILEMTGGLMIGKENSELFEGSKTSAELHNLNHKIISNKDIKENFPQFITNNNELALLEKDAGILFPENCIKTFLDNSNIDFAFNEKVIQINQNKSNIEIITDKNNYKTKKLIISAGAWINKLLPELNLPIKIERQVLFWFKTNNNKFSKEKFPIFLYEYEKDKIFYGFPDIGNGFKVAFHQTNNFIDPDLIEKEVNNKEIDKIKNTLKEFMNLDSFDILKTDVCMYTKTQDTHFIIDYYPDNKNIIIASPCSGHGFKFASVIGKILSDMCIGNKINFDLNLFKISRFI